MENLKKEIFDRVNHLSFIRKIWVNEIQERLARELNKTIPLELIREIIFEIRKAKVNIKWNTEIINEAKQTLNETKQKEKDDWWLKNLTESDKSWLPYRVTDEYYIFVKDYKEYPVLISTVKAIFECYSRFGKDMSWEDVRQQFKLTPLVWNLIKTHTQLYKSSHIDDPITLSRLGKDEVEEYIDGKVPRIIDDKYIEKYKKSVNAKKEADLRKFALSNGWYDIFIEKLEKVIKTYIPRDFENVKIPEIKNHNTKDICIFDIHAGKIWTDGIVVRMKKITRDLVECEEKNINIIIWGDLWEIFIPYGEMHPWQRLGMENINTEELIMLIVDMFEQMLLTLYKAGKRVTLNGMGWNHDRFTEKKEFDPYRTPAMIVYRFLQKIVENTNIKINILREKVNVIKNWKVKYVFLHWDSISETEIKRIALKEQEDWFYLVIITWDKHHYKMTEISDRIVRIQSPALAWQWKYDIDLSMSSQPWIIEIVKNNDGMVDFTVKKYK